MLNSLTKPQSIISGSFQACDKAVSLNNILFDTGALHRSYINKSLVENHRQAWSSSIHPHSSKIRLGDQKTVVNTNEEVHGLLSLQQYNVSANISCIVHDMPGMDLIIGLPDIQQHFLSALFEMLSSNTADVSTLHTSQVFDTEPTPPDCYIWSKAADEGSPEELSTVEPCSFPAFLNFLEVTHAEALRQYHEKLDEHIGPLLKNTPGIKGVMTSQLALDVFVPETWTGIKGVEPINLTFAPDFPSSHKTKARPINPRLYENVKQELTRMQGYMYVPSTSPWASPLVVAPKATAPFIRMCGDYRWLNAYIVLPQAYIPVVDKAILKAANFKYKLDMDLTNSFHQMVISMDTSLRLAVQTPFGLLRPLFMPEGVSPASGYLQTIMMEIFADVEEWTIVIFDNLLVLANTEAEAVSRLEIILKICKERGVVLKLAKSWLGFESVKFFGYKISHEKYEMDADRKSAILEFQMPKSTKDMQRFLGTALFFKSFVVDFSKKCHLLHDMTKKDFNWNPNSWKQDYIEAFETLKKDLANSIAIHFPDYSLKWSLRVDASDYAVGAVLFQERVLEDGKVQQEPIGVASKKFSDIAFKWDPFKKEGYAAYFGVHYFSYYLRGKPFILETDHRNLLWIEKSEVPIVIRWRVYLQSFTIFMKHISGTKNVVADFLSRMNNINESSYLFGLMDQQYTDVGIMLSLLVDYKDTTVQFNLDSKPTIESETKVTPEELIQKVHGGRNLHKGARRTWNALNQYFPGHSISFKFVSDYISSCPVCQKDRLAMTDVLKPIYRHLKPPHQRTRIGVDRLTVTPPDKDGNDTLIVIVEHFTKHVGVYVSKEYTGESIARALFQYFCAYGLFEELISDPGSDLMSRVVKCLNEWIGIRHVVSLVDRHESNGVEQTNNQILRHLRTLVHDLRLVDRWSDPIILSLVIFTLNDSINSETGFRPFDLKFGTQDGPYLQLPKDLPTPEFSHRWLTALNEDLKTVREISTKFQAELIAERSAILPEETQNMFQPGDFVLFQLDPAKPKPTKLSSPYTGPYEVLRQVKNDVECRHVSLGVVRKFHVTRLKLFSGSEEQAKQTALWDADQFVIQKILNWRGDPMRRTTMEFHVLFMDGDLIWLPYSKDLDDSIQYGDYVSAVPMLFPLRYKASEVANNMSRFKKAVIADISIGQLFYLDIRYYGLQWYEELDIPDKYDVIHVVQCKYMEWVNKKHTMIRVFVTVFDEYLQDWNALFIKMYGGITIIESNMKLIDEKYLRRYPQLLKSD